LSVPTATLAPALAADFARAGLKGRLSFPPPDDARAEAAATTPGRPDARQARHR
jgi:predicted small lipoprotein YifL